MVRLDLICQNGCFYAKVVVIGTKKEEVNAIVDTGASTTFVDNDTCIRVGFVSLGFRNVLVASGKRVEFPFWVGRIEVDEYQKNDASILGIPNSEGGVRIEGLLGRDIMQNFKLIIDWSNSTGQLTMN